MGAELFTLKYQLLIDIINIGMNPELTTIRKNQQQSLVNLTTAGLTNEQGNQHIPTKFKLA